MKNPFIDENAQPSFVSLSPLEKDAQLNFHGEVELTLCLSPTNMMIEGKTGTGEQIQSADKNELCGVLSRWLSCWFML